jgi:hypothetical protein
LPQSTPHAPLAGELQTQVACAPDPDATHVQLRRAPDASHCSHVVCVRASQAPPGGPQFVEPHAMYPPQFQ